MWMLHFLHHLADGGTAGYVMANGSMTTNTREEKATRQALVEEGFVDCIVQLPDKLFFRTGIPCCLWFLSKNRDGTPATARAAKFSSWTRARWGRWSIAGTGVERRGHPAHRRGVCRLQALRPAGGRPGFYKVASLDKVRGHDYKLTPGIYVGTQANGEDDEAFEDVMPRMIDELRALFAESERLQGLILADLEGLA